MKVLLEVDIEHVAGPRLIESVLGRYVAEDIDSCMEATWGVDTSRYEIRSVAVVRSRQAVDRVRGRVAS